MTDQNVDFDYEKLKKLYSILLKINNTKSIELDSRAKQYKEIIDTIFNFVKANLYKRISFTHFSVTEDYELIEKIAHYFLLCYLIENGTHPVSQMHFNTTIPLFENSPTPSTNESQIFTQNNPSNKPQDAEQSNLSKEQENIIAPKTSWVQYLWSWISPLAWYQWWRETMQTN